MKFIVFQKMFRHLDTERLVRAAHDWGVSGYDLCLRPGYPVNPDNVVTALPELVKTLRQEDLDIPLITAPGDLLHPDSEVAAGILRGMQNSGVRLLKIGYFRFNPKTQQYWEEVSSICKIVEAWEKTAREFNVKICFHTHSNYNFGFNGASMMHILRGFDPGFIGAYADTGHMAMEGGNFDMEIAIIKDFLSVVGLKDMVKFPPGKDGLPVPYGKAPAGRGMVCWSLVFSELARIGFHGPLSIHCEFLDAAKTWDPGDKRISSEIKFFRDKYSEFED